MLSTLKRHRNKARSRSLQQKAEVARRKKFRTSKEADALRAKGEMSERYGRRLTLEERRAKRAKIAKGRRS